MVRQGKSTTDTIFTFLENIYNNLCKKKHLISTLIDFSKVFDLINYRMLLSKFYY